MKTGYKITTDLLNSSWYYFDSANIIHGPIAFLKFRELVINGVVDVTTKVSRDKVTWQPAAAFDAIGFDCIVVEAGDSYQLYGPFSTDFIDKSELSSGVPANGKLFVRIGNVADVIKAGGVNEFILQDAVDTKKIDELKAANAKLESELAASKQQSAEDKQQLEALSASMASLESAKSTLESELAASKQQSAEDKQQLEALSANIASLEAAKSTLESELATSKQQSAEDKQQLEALSASMASLESAKSTLESELATSKQQSAEDKQQLEALSASMASLESAKSILESELSTSKQQSAEDKQQLEALSARMASLESAKLTLESELATSKHELAASKQENFDIVEQNSNLINQVKYVKEELEQTKVELLEAVKQAQNDLVKEQIKAEQAEVARKSFESEAMRSATLERENAELISENKQLLQQKHELADSLSVVRERLAKEQYRSQQLANAANKIKRRLSRALDNVIDDSPTEDVLTFSTNESGDEFVLDENTNQLDFSKLPQTGDNTVICMDENGEFSERDKEKVKHAISLEAQLQKELMILRSKHSKNAFAKSTNPDSEEKGKSGKSFWKLFSKK